MKIEELIDIAVEAKENSYSPYSKFRVGAAVLTENNNVYSGCNIEIASYSPTICAERTAIFKAVSEGDRKIKRIAITGDSKDTYPCGVCRQVMREFANEAEIIVANSREDYKIYSLGELLPNSFGPDKLERNE